MAIEYTEIDPSVNETNVRARLSDLEAQHQQIYLRVEAPALGEPEGGSEADKEELAKLEKSIDTLRSLLPSKTPTTDTKPSDKPVESSIFDVTK